MVDPRPTGPQPARAACLSRFPPELARRIALTASCRDTDAIPKVERAGELTTIKRTPAQIMHNGVVVEQDGYCGAWMTEIIHRLRGHHEPQEELVFHRLMERVAATETHPTMIELGSYWAYYSLWLRKVVPGSRIVALEPDPAYLDVGRRNFSLNDEEALFVHGLIAQGSGMTAPFVASSDERSYDVPRYDLASLMSLGDLDRVTVVLADIQGAETALIEQATPLLAAGRVRFLVVSTHHHSISGWPTTHQDLLARLEHLGGHIIAEHSVGESFSGDGLIAVAFDAADSDVSVPISRARHRDSLFGEMEPELAAAWERLRAVEHERDAAREELTGAAQMLEDARRCREELERIRGSRTWRWTSRPRAIYRRLRRH